MLLHPASLDKYCATRTSERWKSQRHVPQILWAKTKEQKKKAKKEISDEKVNRHSPDDVDHNRKAEYFLTAVVYL